MKIAFFVSSFPCRSETFIVNQIAGLIDRGHEVHIFADDVNTQEDLHAEYRRYGLLEITRSRRSASVHVSPLLRIAARARLVVANIWRYPSIVLRSLNLFTYGRRALSLYVLDMALRFVDRPAYDIIHCHFGRNGDDAAILIDLGLLKGKLVTTFHGYDIRQGAAIGAKIYRRLVRYCDEVHSISAYNRKWLEAFGFSPRVITHHPPGVDPRRCLPRSHEAGSSYDSSVEILTVARLVEEKGLSFAFEALAEIRKRNYRIRYRILGGGPLETTLRELAVRLRIDDFIEFMGPQDQSVVQSALSRADIFLLPSVAEALPVSIMEAMACALPVIATDVGSVRELVRDDETGYLVPPGNPKALADALMKMLDNRTAWISLGRAGRALVMQQYNIDTLNDRLVERYRALLSGNNNERAQVQ